MTSAGHPASAQRYAELQQLYAEYAAALDEARYADWAELFIDEASYKLQPRENFDRGMALCTLAFESKGMLRDRIYGIEQTLFHAPYYQRHVIGPLRVQVHKDGWKVEGNYAVFRTKVGSLSEVFNVGRFIDEVVERPEGLRFASKHLVFDSELIPNSMIYPL
jgi:salicylate 5-hydroxylase small subunit